jgi:hypothetical protein
VFSSKLGVLNGVLKPEMIQVFNKELYVVEGATVYKYSLPDLKLVKKIGRKGEGPGELKVTPMWYNSISIDANCLFVDGLDKIVYFSLSGEYIKERKKPYNVHQMTPIKDHYVASNMIEMEEKTQNLSINLYDSKLQIVKKIYKQKSPVQSVLETTEMIPDVIHFCVFKDKIYIEKSREGFVIDVYNHSGEKLYRIRKDLQRIPVLEKHRQEAVNKFKQDPFVKQIGFEEFKRMGEFIYPKFFPALQGLIVTDDCIYARTFKKDLGKEEYIILNLTGNIIKRIYLPRVGNAPLMAVLMGVKYYTIYDSKFYYISENEEDETWELFNQEIK